MGTPPPIEIANLGMWDSLILMVMALVVFGPRRLPEIGRQIGKLMYEFRKASNDFKFQMEEELRTSEEADRRKKEEERLQALATPAQPVPTIEGGAATPMLENPNPTEPPSYPPEISADTEPPAEETYPRIMPPSTGEQVPASKPNTALVQVVDEVQVADEVQAADEAGASVAVEPEPAGDPEPAAAIAVDDTPAEHATHDPEQAAHHG